MKNIRKKGTGLAFSVEHPKKFWKVLDNISNIRYIEYIPNKETTMNLTTVFYIAARTEQAYTAAQDFIANECPVIEQRLKAAALSTAITVLEFALIVADWAIAELDKAEEYAVIIALAVVTVKVFAGQQFMKVVRFEQRHQLITKAGKLWGRKGAIAASAVTTKFLRSFNQALQW